MPLDDRKEVCGECPVYSGAALGQKYIRVLGICHLLGNRVLKGRGLQGNRTTGARLSIQHMSRTRDQIALQGQGDREGQLASPWTFTIYIPSSLNSHSQLSQLDETSPELTGSPHFLEAGKKCPALTG